MIPLESLCVIALRALGINLRGIALCHRFARLEDTFWVAWCDVHYGIALRALRINLRGIASVSEGATRRFAEGDRRGGIRAEQSPPEVCRDLAFAMSLEMARGD
jgi:hypothetical protein